MNVYETLWHMTEQRIALKAALEALCDKLDAADHTKPQSKHASKCEICNASDEARKVLWEME